MMPTPNKRRRVEQTLTSDVENVDQVYTQADFQPEYQCPPPMPFNMFPNLGFTPGLTQSFGYQPHLAHLPAHNAFAQYPPSPWANQPGVALMHQGYNGPFILQPGSFVNSFSPQVSAPPQPPSAQGSTPHEEFACDPYRHQHFDSSISLNSAQYCVNPVVSFSPLGPGNLPGVAPSPQVYDVEKVCFGMVTKIEGLYKLTVGITAQGTHPIHFISNEAFISTLDSSLQGTVHPSSTHIISALLDEAELDIEASVSLQDEDQKKIRARGPRFSQACAINIILYGPISLFNEIGSFFEDHDIYLQDPIGCQRNVPYHNPHRLSETPNMPKFTSELETRRQQLQLSLVKDVEASRDLMNALSTQSQENLAETEPPSSLKTSLKRHQKQALTFMLQREMGWAWDGSRPDIWEAKEVGHEKCFANKISGSFQNEEPPQFYGGIIADPMGLGKTLSMISLIASDLEIDYQNSASLTPMDLEDSSRRTLVIVPPPLLSTWEEQLNMHLHPNRLPWCLHHSRWKLTESKLESALMVLTTYHTLSTDWRNKGASDLPILFKTKWKRVILDEAHFVRNSESQMARAVCQLDSLSRWAVTGTPIQNKLGDLAALLTFLRAYPYSQKEDFESDISHLWKCGQDEEAVNRLKKLAGCLILRRSKDIIQLPPRSDMTWRVDISTAERKLYDDIKIQAIKNITQALSRKDGVNHKGSNSFVNVLQRIEALRMVCNLGLGYHDRHNFSQACKDDPKAAQGILDWAASAQQLFNIHRGMRQVQCQDCSYAVDALDAPFGVSEAKPMFSECCIFWCPSCIRDRPDLPLCHHNPSCPVAPVSLNPYTLDEAPIPISPSTEGPGANTPSKIKVLIEDLRSLPTDTKSVVFSTWRMTLDVIEANLRQESIRFLRFDGKVPQKDRQSVIDSFRNDPSIKVLLLTLSCGAVGITLTQASRAYLMEPHWNPTLEDQALARIHRIGQTKEVTTIRFIVKDSFEERIKDLQKSKRDLASILLNGQRSKDDGQPEEALRPLEWLRELLD